MHKNITFIIFVIFIFCNFGYAGETITVREIEGYFYADGKMKRSKGQFEITYYLEGKTITRTRVYDYRKNKVIPDDTFPKQMILNITYKTSYRLTQRPKSGLSRADQLLGQLASQV